MQAHTFFCNEHLFNCMHITQYEKHSQRKKCFCYSIWSSGGINFHWSTGNQHLIFMNWIFAWECKSILLYYINIWMIQEAIQSTCPCTFISASYMTCTDLEGGVRRVQPPSPPQKKPRTPLENSNNRRTPPGKIFLICACMIWLMISRVVQEEERSVNHISWIYM